MVPLDDRQMIADAERATGLSDWGGDDFREPLRVLVAALVGEAQLHAQGARIAQRHLHDVLCGRLKMADDRKRFQKGSKASAPLPAPTNTTAPLTRSSTTVR